MGVEGKDRHVAPRAGLHAGHVRADGLGRVLDDENAARARQIHDRGHVRHIAVEMDHDNGPGAGRENLFQGFGADHAGDGVNVRPDQFCPLLEVGIGRGREGVRGHDNLVAGPEPAQLGRKLQGRNPVHGGEALARAEIVGKALLEGAHVLALGEGFAMPHHLGHDGDFLFRVQDAPAAEIHSEIHEVYPLHQFK